MVAPDSGDEGHSPWFDVPPDERAERNVHALVIGVSRYEHLPEKSDPDAVGTYGLGQVETPAASAFRFARWLRDELRHPDAQAATIRLLLSASDSELEASAELKAAAAQVPGPTRRNVMVALTGWRDECLRHPGDVAVLYVAGHGLQFGARDGGFVMLQDFNDRFARDFENVLDVGAVRDAMSRDDAPQLQVYFVDACRLEPANFKPYMVDPPAAALDKKGEGSASNSFVYFAASPGLAAYADRAKGTIFSEGLMNCFGGVAGSHSDRGWAVTATSLQNSLLGSVPALAEKLDVELEQVPMLTGKYKNPFAVLHVLGEAPAVDAAPGPVTFAANGADGDGQGELRVSVSGLPETPEGLALSVTVEVLDPDDFSLVARTTSGEAIRLDTGRYVVGVVLPSSTREVFTTEVRAGQRSDVPVAWELPPFGTVTARSTSPRRREGVRGVAPRKFALRFLGITDGGADPLHEPPEAGVVACEDALGVLQVSMRVALTDRWHGLRFAQLAVEGRTPVSVALPLAPNSEATECRVNLALSAKHIDAAVQLGGSPEAATVADFVAGGTPDRIVAVPDLARNMLMGQRRHPLGAALAGYALLRSGATEKADWPRGLSEWYLWLPDGAIIAGEQALLDGNVAGALDLLYEAVRRGPPVFTDGLSLLVSRLRGYVRGEDAGQAGRAKEALTPVVDWAAYADLTSLALTISGADLADLDGSQQSVERWSKANGWRIFTVPLGEVDDLDDCWSEED